MNLIFDAFSSSADFFFENTIRVSNSLDPDQDRHSVCKGYQMMTTSRFRVINKM